MKKRKRPLKTKIEMLDLKGWCFSIGSMAAVITLVVVGYMVTQNTHIFASENPVAAAEPVIQAEAITNEAPVTYNEEIPLDAELQLHIVNECEKANIRPEIVFAMIQRESSYKADAIGDNGDSYGLMQVQPKHHYARMLELNCTNLLDPKQNVTVGIDILAELINKDKGIVWALMAYNGGESYAN